MSPVGIASKTLTLQTICPVPVNRSVGTWLSQVGAIVSELKPLETQQPLELLLE
jgi:hypothetical protein